MNDENSKRRLGRGLAALIGEMDQPVVEETSATRSGDRSLPIEFLNRSMANPRRQFDADELAELSNSIRQHGVVQPVVVRQLAEEQYEIIAGERRWRAAQLAGLAEIPVLVRDVDDRTALEIAIVENVQRSDLNAVEEALGYEALIAEHAYTQNDLGEIIGKSRSHIANTLRLLKLPNTVREMVADGRLSAGHARTLVNSEAAEAIANKIIQDGLSVRDAERLAQSANDDVVKPNGPSKPTKDADTLALERRLSDALGLKVSVSHGDSGGNLKIDYKTIDQLDEICRLLGSR